MHRILAVTVVTVAYILSALFLHIVGIFRVVSGVVGGAHGRWVVDYAGPPVLSGLLFAVLAFGFWGEVRLSWRWVFGMSVCVAFLVVGINYRALWIHPAAIWLAIRDRWAEPYVEEAVFLIQRDLTYSLLCTFCAGAALLVTQRKRGRLQERRSSPTRE